MHPQTLPDSLWNLLPRLDGIPGIALTYLGGGSAMALSLGHRKSEDLDFFVREDFDDLTFLRNARTQKLDTLLLHQTQAHTVLMIERVKVDLIKERIPLMFPLKPVLPEMKNLKIADPRDIGRMKILSIGSRGSKKDFVDLFCLTRDTISLESLLSMIMAESQGIRYSKLHFLKGLVDFEEADQEGELAMIWNLSWEEIKRILREEVKGIAKHLTHQ
jgi:hypothetical protein